VRHLLRIADLSADELRTILSLSGGSRPRPAESGQGVALYFEKPSARTRNSIELASSQLGLHPVYLQPQELGLGTRETVADVTRTLACYHRVIAARVFDHAVLEEMAAVNAAPVLNMLSGTDHPLQALADLKTIDELCGRIEGVKIAFLGDGDNNVARSLAEGCAMLGAELTIAAPAAYQLKDAPAGTRQTEHASEAVAGADVVYSDVFVSMGQDDERERRLTELKGYQVNADLMARAPDAHFLHCLPAHRGEEVTAEVIDGPQSAVWQQAINRMHTARGALLWLLDVPSSQEF